MKDSLTSINPLSQQPEISNGFQVKPGNVSKCLFVDSKQTHTTVSGGTYYKLLLLL